MAIEQQFYKPTSTDCKGVYRDYKNAKEDYPNADIFVVERKSEKIIDDEQDRTVTYYVDIPTTINEEWENIKQFKTRSY